MAKSDTASPHLRKGAKVVARTELRGVPEGTPGKVVLVAGLSWIRYWVRFENGVSLGTVDRKVLATPDEWRRHLNGEEELVVVGGDAADSPGGGDEGGGDAGGKATPSGTLVPQKLLDRSAAARTRLAA
ncbi:MAG: hypothetical protein R2746_05860 [Acidimicrobiales bacterium]|nr:hypothetical protein [Actinomycetota bacterium]